MHELDDAARLEALPRVAEAGPAVLVAGEPAAGEVAVPAHHLLIVPLGRAQVFRVAGLQPVDGRLAEALGDVDVVPVDDARRPVGGQVLVELPRQPQ